MERLYVAATLTEARQLARNATWVKGWDGKAKLQLDGWEKQRRSIRSSISKIAKKKKYDDEFLSNSIVRKYAPKRDESGTLCFYRSDLTEWAAAWDFAWDMTLWEQYQWCCEVGFGDRFPAGTHDYLLRRLGVWERGLCLYGDVEGVFHIYAKGA